MDPGICRYRRIISLGIGFIFLFLSAAAGCAAGQTVQSQTDAAAAVSASLPRSGLEHETARSPDRTDVTLTATPQASAPIPPKVTAAPTPEATPVSTAASTSEPAPTPTAAPTSEPAPTPTAAPTSEPAPTPTAAPEPDPTLAPTAVPTPEPSGIQINLPGVPLNWPLSASQKTRVDHFIDLVNQARADEGLPALAAGGSALQEAAAIRAAEISVKFSHDRPTDQADSIVWYSLLGALDISYWWAGENIAGGQATPEAAMQDLMNSPGHRSNILNASADTLAIGVYTDSSGRNWWVQEFIKSR